MPDTTQPISKLHQIIVTTDALIAEAWEALERSETPFGKQLGQDALDLSRSIKTNYIAGCAHSLIVLAETARNEGQYGTAIAYIMEAELLYEDLPSDIWLARGLYILGFSQEHLGNHSEALRIFHAQFDIAQEIENHTYQATALRRIGSLHSIRNQTGKALKYFERCLLLYDSTDDKTGLAGVYTNMSEIYYAQEKYDKAIGLAKQSLTLHKAQNLIAPRTFSHSSLARVYLAKGNIELAEYHIAESLKFARLSGRNYPQIAALKAVSIIRNQMQQPLQALSHLQEALKLAIRSDDRFEGSECHRLLADTYASLGQFDAAYEHQKECQKIRENLWHESNKTRFESLEILYQTRQAQIEANIQRELRENDQRYFEKLSAIKDGIISTASHDLKNPLASLSLTIELLTRHGRTNDKRGQELIDRVQEIIKQMRELIMNVLDLARLETGQAITTQAQDFIAFVRRVLEGHRLSAETKQIMITLKSDLEKQDLYFDAKSMEQVINNLVTNAIKYSSENGQLMVSIVEDNNWILTKVSDSGMGIPSEALPNIFERFYRVDSEQHRSVEGTGLGLAICKSIIEQHSGTISVESTVGEGSTFQFSIPLGESKNR